MKKLTIGLVIILLIIIVFVLILSNRKNTSKFSGPSTPTVTPASVKKNQNPLYQEGKQTFVVYVKNWDFNPAQVRVKQGDTVVLKIKSLDVKHGINIQGYGINKNLPPFSWQTVEFRADKRGTYTYTCTVNCGPKSSMMKGVLVVE